MSVYDPFQLYVHHQKKSHAGQVIRKRPTTRQNYAISEEMIKDAKDILIKAGIRSFNSTNNQRLFQYKTYPNLQVTNFDIPIGSTTELFKFSNFWDLIKQDYASIYNNISPLQVQNINFELQLNSVFFGPYVTASKSRTDSVDALFTFDGYSSSEPVTFPLLTGQFSIQCTSYSNSQWIYVLNTSGNSFTDDTKFVNKDTQTSHQFLSQVVNHSPAILTVLKNSDYAVFNPTLFSFILNNSNENENTFTLSNIVYNVSVGLAVEYK